MNKAAASCVPEWSCADQVLELPDDFAVRSFVQDLVSTRQLSYYIKQLNDSVLSGTGQAHDRAVAALDRMGFWVD